MQEVALEHALPLPTSPPLSPPTFPEGTAAAVVVGRWHGSRSSSHTSPWRPCDTHWDGSTFENNIRRW